MNTSDDPNTEHSMWDAAGLNVGDRIEIEVLSDGEADPPNNVSRTSDNPNNLFSDVEQARLLFAAIKTTTRLYGKSPSVPEVQSPKMSFVG
jgi:hypothetical protein